MNNPPFDLATAHRWFAVELNNVAWELVEAPQRSPEEIERMIHAAHGACYFWLQGGDLLNHLRAQCLLATAYHAAGMGREAVRHAERCLEMSQEAGDRQTAFDRATAHGCASRAYALSNHFGSARRHYELAKAAAAGFTDAEEKQVFERLYPEP
jgi:hypothetical protein